MLMLSYIAVLPLPRHAPMARFPAILPPYYAAGFAFAMHADFLSIIFATIFASYLLILCDARAAHAMRFICTQLMPLIFLMR